MRSRLEARVAAWLDASDFLWRYEPRAFAGINGEYLPDFGFSPIPQSLGWGGSLLAHDKVPAYLEVKPPGISIPFWQHRMATIWESDPAAVLVIAAPAETVLGYRGAGEGAVVRVGLGPGWESDEPGLFGPTWDSGWFGRCTECEHVSLYFGAGYWACSWCGHYEGNGGWSDLTNWPYLVEWCGA